MTMAAYNDDDENVIDLAAQKAERDAFARRFGDEFFMSIKDPNTGRIQRVFLSATLAEAVIQAGPLAVGRDDFLWSFEGGVWVQSRDVVRNRATRMLGEVYKRDHRATAEDHVRRMLEDDGRVIGDTPPTDVINFRNGLLRWKSGEWLDHTPDLLTTIQLAVDYDPEATCPEFDAFLNQVVDPDMIPTVWEVIGYLMFTGNPLHKAVMLTGSGRNGKGTLLRVITSLLGEHNVSSVTLQGLAKEKFQRVALYNKLANIAGDLDSTYLSETGAFKSITGQDLIHAEYKGRDGFHFTAHAVPVFSANEIPASSDSTDGYFSRWLVVPFPNSFLGKEDATLEARLTTPGELQGIARRAVAALRDLMERNRFQDTESSEAAMREFRRASDPVMGWLEERCDIDPELPPFNRKQLYDDYKAWTTENGHRVLSGVKFYARLRSHGLSPCKVQGIQSLRGVRLAPRDPFTGN